MKTEEQTTLRAKEKFAQISERYKNTAQNTTFNALIYGDFGTGKTSLLKTCPKPVYIHSFDPGGTKSIRREIEKGDIIADTSFEFSEKADALSLYKEWDREFREMKNNGIFNHIGTFVIDSGTMLNKILLEVASSVNSKNTPISGLNIRVAFLQDYRVQMVALEMIVKECTGLPCHFIMTGHVDRQKDETTGSFVNGPMLTGKHTQEIPLLFDEVYVAGNKQTSKGQEYYLITQNEGAFKARSRLAGMYPLDRREPQDIKALLKKCDFTYEDKENVLTETTDKQI